MSAPSSVWGMDPNTWANIMPAIGAAAGAFPQTQSINGTGSSTTSGTSNTLSNTDLNSLLNTLANLSSKSSTQTGYGPQGDQLISSLLPTAQGQASRVNLTPYAAQQTAQINQNSNLQRQAADNIMAARGLASSPVAVTTDTNIDNARIGQITGLQESLPMLRNELTNQNLAASNSVLANLPRTQTGTASQAQSTNQTGSTIGNTTQNSTMNQQQQQQMQQQQKSGGGIGGLLGGLGAVIGSVFGL